jgi:hypothetical protein
MRNNGTGPAHSQVTHDDGLVMTYELSAHRNHLSHNQADVFTSGSTYVSIPLVYLLVVSASACGSPEAHLLGECPHLVPSFSLQGA